MIKAVEYFTIQKELSRREIDGIGLQMTLTDCFFQSQQNHENHFIGLLTENSFQAFC